MANLSKIGERERLKPQPGDEPYWQRLRAGCFVGYRPSKRGGRGSWFARAYNADTLRYSRKPLGTYASLTGNDVFSSAKKDAEAWCEQVECGGTRTEKLVTVADACRAYMKQKPGNIAEGVFRRQVYDDPLAKIRLDKLRRHHLQEWRARLESTPALISRSAKGEPRTKARASSTINRDMVPLRAALGRVLSPGTPNTDAAWQEALKPIAGAGQRRELYLDINARKRLLEAVAPDAAPLLRALSILPLRPGALANLRVGQFEPKTRTLTIGKDKNGRPRQIAVPPSIAEFLCNASKDKLPVAHIFARGDGRPWNKDAWKHPIKAAVLKAKLPTGVCAYTLRHSVITDIVRNRLPLLTVARLAGTSVAMIEKHYGHLVAEDAEQALAALSF